ncbi:MAG: DUF2911 domain-containing protein [Bacteroidota bacterium]
MKKVLFFLALLVGFAAQVDAQIKTPAPSPAAKLEQTVGLTDIHIEYSRPAMKGRKIFANDGLVPYGDVWRTGANQATKLTFTTDVKVGGVDLEAGTYAMLTKPTASDWTVMLFTHESTNWGSYTDKTPAAEFKAKSMKSAMTIESFQFMVDGINNDGANIMMGWENTVAMFPVEVPTQKMAMASIERTMAGPGPNDYYAAASYLQSEGKDLKKAHEWVKMANKDNARFWTLRLQSQIEADLGMHKEAVETAKRSLKMAKEAGNKDYIRMNETNIKKWQTM